MMAEGRRIDKVPHVEVVNANLACRTLQPWGGLCLAHRGTPQPTSDNNRHLLFTFLATPEALPTPIVDQLFARTCACSNYQAYGDIIGFRKDGSIKRTYSS
jgi:hypothetical protein